MQGCENKERNLNEFNARFKYTHCFLDFENVLNAMKEGENAAKCPEKSKMASSNFSLENRRRDIFCRSAN
jgi:hypothetical protein